MGDEGFVVRCRGLPWTATVEDVFKFFEGCQINRGQEGIHLTKSRDGRPSGEAFVEFASEEDVQMAVKKNKDHLGSRYVEVFRSKKGEMEWVVKRSGFETPSNLADAVVKLRGVPFGCSKEEIAQFFTGLEIVPNGIMLPEDRLGRSTGEAFVQFASQDIAERALGKHKDRIGHRYIEIFKSSMGECQAVFGQGGMRPPMGMPGMPGMPMGRPSPYDRNERFPNMPPMPGMGNMGPPPMGPFAARGRGGRNLKGFYEDDFDDYGMAFGNMSFIANRGRGGMRPPRGRGMQGGMMMDDRPRGPPGSQYVSKTGHSVHMRGMPFLAIEQDVFDFFAPLQPVRVDFEYGSDGRRTGEANVDFASHQEAMEAMKKHRANMQHRYIELFLNSTPNTRGGLEGCGGGYAGDMGGGGFSTNSMGGGGGNFGGSTGGGYGSNTGSGFGMGGGGGGSGGGYNSSSFSSGPGQQYSSSMGGSGYGMGGSSLTGGSMGGAGNMGGSSTYGGGQGGMNSFMDGGGYSNMGGSMQNPNYTAF